MKNNKQNVQCHAGMYQDKSGSADFPCNIINGWVLITGGSIKAVYSIATGGGEIFRADQSNI